MISSLPAGRARPPAAGQALSAPSIPHEHPAPAAPLLSAGMRAFAALGAGCGQPILLLGETGCGKTFLAREIHRESARAAKPFVRVNCAAIPETLFEREMFGHVRGAFTDAREDGAGFFEAARGGTLFLDEVGEIPLGVQPKLLAALEEGCFRRLGSPREIRADVRIISATNRDLAEMVRQRQFRQDLFYRFSVLQYCVPPLRERCDELPGIVAFLLGKTARPGAEPARLTEEAWELVLRYPWPGNLREMENALSAAAAFADGAAVLPQHLPPALRADAAGGRAARLPGEPRRYAAPEDPEQELNMIREALRGARGNKTAAAQSLGMSRSTLWAKLQRYGALAG